MKSMKATQNEVIIKEPAGNSWQQPVEEIEEIDPLSFYQDTSFYCLTKKSPLRYWAVQITLSPYFERLTMTIILLNCITLGLYDPYDAKCVTKKCKVLENIEKSIYVYFVLEMLVKMLAFGIFGKLGYLTESWNRLDLFIVAAGTFELAYGDGEFLSSVRAIRVLRPLRAINRVPSIRILVTLLLDTLPMLGNVFILCILILIVFAIIGVQLWQGILRNRCYLDLPANFSEHLQLYNITLQPYYIEEGGDHWNLICSSSENSGQVSCRSPYVSHYTNQYDQTCTMKLVDYLTNTTTSNSSALFHNISQAYLNPSNDSACFDWNSLYTKCLPEAKNPYFNTISFDNTGEAFIAIFQAITLEGWTDIMYFLQDAYSQWVWIYFVTLIVIGSYFLTNLCLVVVATQFSETRQREYALMAEARREMKLRASTVMSMSENGESGCYLQILGLIRYHLKKGMMCLKRAYINRSDMRKKRNLTEGAVHFHHHHHHHVHHHHLHLCPNAKHTSTSDTQSRSVHIDDFVEDDPFNSLTPLASLPSNTNSLVIPDATVVICHSSMNSITSSGAVISMLQPPSKMNRASFQESIRRHSLSSVLENPSSNDNKTQCTHLDDEEGSIIIKEQSLCSSYQEKVRKFCNTSVFETTIMMAIFLNSITMACEHYQQPASLTLALDIFNTIFTSMFMLECVSKVFGYGFYGYIKDPFNVFDGTIVIISLVEMCGSRDSGGVSVLRTFRLMRIFKLIRFMPMLQQQIKVMLATLDSVMTFLGLLTIFIFTSSILGMNLFGASMDFEDGKARHNFDNLMWSLITVFQVLTQEDWNAVLYDAMRGTSKWAAIYFVLLMIVGNYILFNLLVAILVEGFSTESEGILSLPKKSPTFSEVTSPVRTSQYAKSKYLSLPNILSDDSKGVIEPNFESKSLIAWRSTSDVERDEPQKNIEHKENKGCKISIFERRRDWSFYIVSPGNRLRIKVKDICASPWFDNTILFFIFCNCLIMALENPTIQPKSLERKIIDYSNLVFTGVFTIEMSIKIFAYGFYFGENSAYLKNGWNRIDFILVIISLSDIFITYVIQIQSSILGVLKVFRAFRTLRPLRVISRAPGLKIVVETLIASLAPIGNLVVVGLVFFSIFGILGVQLFKGKFYYCKAVPFDRPVVNRTQCLEFGGVWINKKYTFDNLFQALFSLFVFATKDGWVTLMYDGIDAVGINMQPQKNHNPWAFIYFVTFLLIAGFVVINMVVGVIIDNFQKCRVRVEDEIAAGVKEENSAIARDTTETPRGLSEYSTARILVYKIVSHYKFDLIIAVVIGLNVLFMALEYYQMPPMLVLFLKIMNYIFTAVFILEAIFKIYGLGPRLFFSQRWNQLDIVIVFLSIIGVIFEELDSRLPINPTIIRIMRVLRIARVLKILKAADGIQKLLNCVSEAIPQVGNLSMLFGLIFFIFAALGIELFGKLDCSLDDCSGISRHAHFENFGYALLTLFRISTGDNWSGILKDAINTKLCSEACPMLPYIAPMYFAVFVLASQFVLVNVVVAVLMKQLEDSKSFEESLANTRPLSTSSEVYYNRGSVYLDDCQPHQDHEAFDQPESRSQLSLYDNISRYSFLDTVCKPTERNSVLFEAVYKATRSEITDDDFYNLYNVHSRESFTIPNIPTIQIDEAVGRQAMNKTARPHEVNRLSVCSRKSTTVEVKATVKHAPQNTDSENSRIARKISNAPVPKGPELLKPDLKTISQLSDGEETNGLTNNIALSGAALESLCSPKTGSKFPNAINSKNCANLRNKTFPQYFPQNTKLNTVNSPTKNEFSTISSKMVDGVTDDSLKSKLQVENNDITDTNITKPSRQKEISEKWPSNHYISDKQPSNRNLSDKRPSNHYISDGQPSNRNLPDKRPSNHYISDGQPSNRNLSDKRPSNHYISDEQPSNRNLPDKRPSNLYINDKQPSEQKAIPEKMPSIKRVPDTCINEPNMNNNAQKELFQVVGK